MIQVEVHLDNDGEVVTAVAVVMTQKKVRMIYTLSSNLDDDDDDADSGNKEGGNDDDETDHG